MIHFDRFLTIFCAVIGLAISGCDSDPQPPNIILIMGDDSGFSDIGCYGSEIPTPNLDKLASQGLRFRQFYNMSKCETTRSSMLTGLYQGDARALSMIGLLRDNGYQTYQFGKDHFASWVPKSCYAANNNNQSLTFWATTEYFVPPDSNFSRPFILNGQEVNAWELDYEIEPFYKTDVFTDYALRYLDSTLESDRPYFLYLPYHSAHYPLQARQEDIARFEGTYLEGWDQLRQARYERMIEMGVLNPKYKLSAPEGNINKFRGHPKGDEEIREKIPLYRPWDQLTEEEKEQLDLEMAVFAAMVYRMDHNIGRVMRWLEEHNQVDNTLVMFLSDNGSCPFDSNRDFDHPPGGAASYRTLSAAWANLGNTPFRYYKQFGHEGGAHTHFIASWPAVIKDQGGLTDQPGHVIDMFPTILDITGIAYPSQVNGRPTIPLEGSSLLPVFRGQERKEPEYLVSGFTERFRMYRRGDWKIVKANDVEWQLYNLEDDLTETNDLSASQPEKVQELVDAYEQWKENLPEKP